MSSILKHLPKAILTFLVLSPVPVYAGDTANVYYGIKLEELEYRISDTGDDLFVWDGNGYVGTDELKLRWDGDAEYDLNAHEFGSLSNQLSLATPISDFWDIKGGVRYTSPEGPDRWYAAVGLYGLAPQWFEVDTNFYISEKGKASADLDVQYQVLLTNYLILTPSAKIDAAFSSDPEIGVGSGVNGVELGLRLSYDVLDRAISPYIGVVYERKFGQTANFLQSEGEDPAAWNFVIGTKLMF